MKLRSRESRVNLVYLEVVVCDFELAVINVQQHTVHVYTVFPGTLMRFQLSSFLTMFSGQFVIEACKMTE
jgi:hypothetical protein